MARSNFGGSDTGALAIQAPAGNSGVVKSAPSISTGTAWSASSGGTQYTDMMLSGGGASAVVLTDSNGFVHAFQGPDGVNEGLWVDLGSGRFYLRTTDALSSTYAPQRASMRYDPAGKADGAIGATADTGQALTAFAVTGHSELPVIAAGVIAHTPYAGANSAGYLQADLGARVHRIGAMITWPMSAVGVAALVIPSAPWTPSALPNAGFHLTMSGNGVWTLIRYSGGGSTTLAEYGTHGRWQTVWGTGPQPFEFWIDPDNSRAVLCWPDGSRSVVTSAYFNTETANYAIWELFENNGVTDVPVTFGAIWADTAPIGPDASSGVYRNAINNPNAAPINLTTSGAVTLNLSTTCIHILTLNGNVTSFAFSNPKGSQQEIDVYFNQDATGSRTLAGAAATIKWAGGVAPTLTTTAGRRDIFRFRYVNSVYVELSRSMNVQA